MVCCILSQDDLQALLEQLLKSIETKGSLIEKLKSLENEHRFLKEAVLEPRKRKEAYDKASLTLNTLLKQSSYNEQILKAEYPAKLLKGNIDLSTAKQKNAISELSITLSQNPNFSEDLLKITNAIRLFYQDFFQNDQAEAPKNDPEAEEKLKAFEEDSKRGKWPPYQNYLNYEACLQEVEKTEDFDKLSKNRPDFYINLHIEQLFRSKNQALKKYLLDHSEWSNRYQKALEKYFKIEKSEELKIKALSLIQKKCSAMDPTFLDEQLSDSSQSPLIIEFLKNFDTDQLSHMLIISVQKNLQNLMSVLINFSGFDSKYFYSSLSQGQMQPDVFKRMIDSLFRPLSPQGRYGIDSQYAQKVIKEQKNIPKNVVKTLQTTMPRGFEGNPIVGYFKLLAKFNEEMENMYREKRKLDQLQSKDQSYCDHVLRMSDTETIRFILFTYIFDVIKYGIYPNKIGMSRSKVKNTLIEQYDFEMKIGHNPNITKSIQDLWTLFPDLKPIDPDESDA